MKVFGDKSLKIDNSIKYLSYCRDIKFRRVSSVSEGVKMAAIGIDLGTSYSCVAVWKEGTAHVIANDQGNRTTPSYVSFNAAERSVGESAKNQVFMNPENTIFDAKRLIGRHYNDPMIQDDLSYWPFSVVNEGGKPMVEVEFMMKKKRFSAEEITSMVLAKMKQTAEDFLGTPVKSAVISVPAYFNDSQRQATKDAATIAGLQVLRLINEPTAAALAYGLENFKNESKTRHILVFDLGGGTLDVTVVAVSAGQKFQVLATAGDTHLGGEDFDTRLVGYLADEFQRTDMKDVKKNPRALRRLRATAERAKRSLSSTNEVSIEVDGLLDGVDFYVKVSRARFEELCVDLFQATLDPVAKALVTAKMDKDFIDEVVLVGGSTRIPKIQNLLRCFFNRVELKLTNLDETVACGAAIQAALLSGNMTSGVDGVALSDVAPYSIGVEMDQDIMRFVIERNTQLPCIFTKVYTTCWDDQTTINIGVYQGESLRTEENYFLGEYNLQGIAPAPRGVPNILVTFYMDENAILHLTATDGESHIVVKRKENCRLSLEEVKEMLVEAERYREDDERQREVVNARLQLEAYVYNVKAALNEAGIALDEKELKETRKSCDKALQWLEKNKMATKDKYEQQYGVLQNKCSRLLIKIHGQKTPRTQRRMLDKEDKANEAGMQRSYIIST